MFIATQASTSELRQEFHVPLTTSLNFIPISPKGICRPAQGCCTQLPWERGDQCTNPNGVASDCAQRPVMAFEV